MKNISREKFLKIATGSIPTLLLAGNLSAQKKIDTRPNILFAISDDQSWLHTTINGTKAVKTPIFDSIAKKGILFNNAFVVAPQCSPNRASILTGRYIWQLEEAGTHASNFPAKFKVFPNILKEHGYAIGYTGKGWGPGNWKITGRKTNPAGSAFNKIKNKNIPTSQIHKEDYAANFKQFLQKTGNKPFCFWYGSHEPHRKYEKGSGLRAGKKISDVVVPPFLPDTPEIRSDILDYLLEIEWFDKHLGRMLKILEENNQLDNTIVIVTSDNGMPFPRAKANLYEYGIHMPLAISWAKNIKPNRVVDDLISFVDFAPTFLEAAGIKPSKEITGKSFLNILHSNKQGIVDDSRKYILAGRERHTHARPDNLGYPVRAIRDQDYLYIWNVKPDRFPAGDPTGSGYPEEYHDIDPSPSKTFMIHKQEKYQKIFKLAFGKRPPEELYNIKTDPECLNNLAYIDKYKYVMKSLREILKKNLKAQKDPRMLGKGDIFESYPRYSFMRKFKGFRERGKYNKKFQVK